MFVNVFYNDLEVRIHFYLDYNANLPVHISVLCVMLKIPVLILWYSESRESIRVTITTGVDPHELGERLT